MALVFRQAAAFLVAASCVVLATGCVDDGIQAATRSSGSSNVSSIRELASLVSSLQDDIECAGVVPIQADILVYDRARGFDCLRHDGHAIIVRAYAHAETVDPVITEWSPTFGTDRVWTRGDHWVAFGPRDAIVELARRHSGSPASSRTLAVGPTPEAAARDSCMGFVSGAAGEAVTDPSRYATEADQLDRQFVGTARLIRDRITPEFRERWKDAPDYERSAALSSFGEDFRAVCGAAKPQR